MAKILGTTDTKSTRKNKPFRVWDGEGMVRDGKHLLVLLANSDGEFIENIEGLSTRDCVRFLLKKRPKAHNVWFAFGYDVNKIVTDLPLYGQRGTIQQLWETGRTWWWGVFFKYIPRKFLTVREGKQSFLSTDTFSFFQMSFLRACEEWGIDAKKIVQGKKDRNIFNTWTLPQIREYNFWELRIAKRLMEKLRDSFAKIGIHPTSWHGPGAIATQWLQNEGIQYHYGPTPEAMKQPILHAYFGGRIDTAIVGEVDAEQYDITSAYPAGLCDCLSLASLQWKAIVPQSPNHLLRHGLYHCKWKVNPNKHGLWNPFPWRSKRGRVLFPPEGEGWYWGVEIIAALRLLQENEVQILEGWIPEGPQRFPFKEAIERDFQKRKDVGKNTGPGIALKLVLNSLYGKLCQHVSGDKDKPPRWQNYVWAGYVTAFTRAKILDAIAEVGSENVLAIATDGIFLRTPLDLINEGSGLGKWENKGKAQTLFIAPGVYAVFGKGKPSLVKQRGFPANINYGWVLREWGCNTTLNVPNAKGEFINSMSSEFEAFIGMGKALNTNKPHGVFVTETRFMRNVTLVGTSKRFPDAHQFISEEPWSEFVLLPRKRDEDCISYPYEWREEFDPKDEKEE